MTVSRVVPGSSEKMLAKAVTLVAEENGPQPGAPRWVDLTGGWRSG